MKEAQILEYLGPEPEDLGAWMSTGNPQDLETSVALVQACLKDPKLLSLYEEGDQMSSSQTKHDIGHAYAVHDVAMSLLREYEALHPGELDEWTTKVVVPLAAFLHDIGRAVAVDNHAVAGAAIMNVYLRRLRLPREIVRRICRIIALHRSAQVLKLEFNDPAWAFVVIADKCVGDEDRVRRTQANILRVLRFFRAARRNWWKDAEHQRANFAIKQAHLIVDSNQDMLVSEFRSERPVYALVLRIALDEKVAHAQEVMTLYGNRFHACGRAAQYLGFVFRLEFNGVRYMYDKSKCNWRPVQLSETAIFG